VIPETSKEQKLDNIKKRNATSLQQLLGGYTANITGDTDALWQEKDLDGNGFLDKGEAKQFIEAL